MKAVGPGRYVMKSNTPVTRNVRRARGSPVLPVLKLMYPISDQPFGPRVTFANGLHLFMHIIDESYAISHLRRCAQHSRPIVAPRRFRIQLTWAGQPSTTFVRERISDGTAQYAKIECPYRSTMTIRMTHMGYGGYRNMSSTTTWGG
jgi:hypothetical protein